MIGTSIDNLVSARKSVSLVDESPSGLPHEARFESKFGESIPVSYTCSVLEGKEAESGDRIYAAQNITERRRAEKRIRYLARIASLTRIPNRMQFQHLLQQAIARAKRAGQGLCLIYIDIDNFKDINDTFGHLAGHTTLETVAERLSEELPPETVIGRLEGVLTDQDGTHVLWLTDELAVELTNDLRYVNHSDTPNCELTDMGLVTLRAVDPGEELTHDYGW